MATNEIFKDADSLPYAVTSAVVSGNIVVFPSGLVGVAETDAELREDGIYYATVRTKGVWGFDVTALAGNIARYAAVYASATPSAGLGVVGTFAGTTSSSNTRIGTIFHSASTGATRVFVRIGSV